MILYTHIHRYIRYSTTSHQLTVAKVSLPPQVVGAGTCAAFSAVAGSRSSPTISGSPTGAAAILDCVGTSLRSF